MEILSKKEKGLRDTDNSVVIGGELKIEVSISGINGHGKIVKIYSEIYLFIRYY